VSLGYPQLTLALRTFAARACTQVRWLATTTPAPKSPLHAHRVMCLSILPPPPLSSRLPRACKTLFVTGDSGGGVTVFELQQAAAAPSAADGGSREHRCHPAGRWMAPGERPVLCMAHARVPSSASKDISADFLVTGDTRGTVTVWEVLPREGGGGCGGGVPPSVDQATAGVRGGFVHRGPAGKRRGGNGVDPDLGAGGKPPSFPGLAPVLEYRAHQVYGTYSAPTPEAVRLEGCVLHQTPVALYSYTDS